MNSLLVVRLPIAIGRAVTRHVHQFAAVAIAGADKRAERPATEQSRLQLRRC